MKRPWLMAVIVANLLALVALVFVYPHLMISPGTLVGAHAELATDCFACHAALRGASSERCTACHATSDIGLRTTKGVPLPPAAGHVAFHQELIEQDCMACHSDHQGPKLTQRSRKPFSHALLRAETRDRCESCHSAPKNNVHRDLKASCASCHSTDRWTPATFKHELLSQAVLAACEACHKAPTDNLHRKITGECSQCHTPKAWKPATFDHDKHFVLDGDHNTACETCHTNSDFSRYTCYGCHEHTPAKVRAEHEEEGIRDFQNCVKCHRSANEEPTREGSGGSGDHRERD